MKTRILSLVAFLFLGMISDVSAIRIQGRSIGRISVSQLSYSEKASFDIQGKIWGKAPKGDVTQVWYNITDADGAKIWEFTAPFVQTFDGTEELDIDFEFDFSDVLVDGNSKLLVKLQNASMNGAFVKTLAQGELKLVFSESITAERVVSRIEQFDVNIDGKNVVTQTHFNNLNEESRFFTKVQILNSSGELIEERTSTIKTVLAEETLQFSTLLDIPSMPGRYEITTQVFENKKAATGTRKQSIRIEGDFAIISALEVTPEEYFYAGDTVKIKFAGASSVLETPITVALTIKESSGKEVYRKELPIQTDIIGKFSGEIEFPIKTETEQLQTKIELRRGEKKLGTYEFLTQKSRKTHAAEGQSAASFAIEQMTQDFLLKDTRAKAEIVISFIILLLLITGFVFFVRHIRSAHILVLMIAFFIASGSVVAEDIVLEGGVSYEPQNGWIFNPKSNDNFEKMHFKGDIDMGGIDAFEVDKNIDAKVAFYTTDDQEIGSANVPFKVLTANSYDFIVTVPNQLVDREYYPVVVLKGPGIGDSVPGEEIEIHWETGEVGVDREYELLVAMDSTPPVAEFQYFKDGEILGDGEFSKDPLYVEVICNDDTGCYFDTLAEGDEITNRFEVKGNFCSGQGSFCDHNATDEFVICDQVGNCSDPEQIEINTYDPVKPTLDSFDIKQAVDGGLSAKAETGIKAVESYIFSLVNLVDPKKNEEQDLDSSACGDSDDNSPFYSDQVCKEKLLSCAELPSVRGFWDYDGDGTCQEGCPSLYEKVNGVCVFMGCSNTNFPFCFEWVLNGECKFFPFCFQWSLE